MPFKLQISAVEYLGTEIAISGKLLEGAYSGPEAIFVAGKAGDSVTVPVTHHSLYLPKDWPVLPSHDTVLTLSIDTPCSDFRVDESQPIIGRGSVFENPNKVDISDVLSDPVFWATQLSLTLGSDDVEEPNEAYFGISTDQVNRYYRDVIDSRLGAGVWPYIRLPVDDSKFVEIEFAASVEYQDRFWIGQSRIPHRALLGYHSGHFSLPAFRFEEILWFHELLGRSCQYRTSVLLLMSACYVQNPSGLPLELALDLFSYLPGVKPGASQLMAKTFLDNLTITNVNWQHDSDFGWINNWRYSQRNPRSTMSVLSRDDFAFITKYFWRGAPKQTAVRDHG